MCEQKRNSCGNTDLVVIQILFKQEESRNWTWKCAFRAGWVKSLSYCLWKAILICRLYKSVWDVFLSADLLSISMIVVNVLWLWITSTVSESLVGGQYEEKLFVAGRWGLPSHSTTPPPHSGQTQIRFQSSNSKFDPFHVEIICAHKHGACMYYGSFTPCVFVMHSC